MAHLITHLLIPSDKRNSITAKLIFFTVQCRFIPRHALLPISALPSLPSWLYQSLPLISFVFHSFLHCCVTKTLTICGKRVIASVRDLHKCMCSAGRGTLMLFFACNLSKVLRELGEKQSLVMKRHTHF